MHHVRVASLLCALTLASTAAMAADDAPSAGECFTRAFKAADAEAVSACYADDGIIWFPGGPMAQGRPAIREGFAHFFSTVTVKDIAMTDIGHVMGEGDTDGGIWTVGQSQGQIHDIPTCKELVANIMAQAEAVRARIDRSAA